MSSLSVKICKSVTDGPVFITDSTTFLVQKVLAYNVSPFVSWGDHTPYITRCPWSFLEAQIHRPAVQSSLVNILVYRAVNLSKGCFSFPVTNLVPNFYNTIKA